MDGGFNGQTALPAPWGGGDAHKLSSGWVGNRRRLPGIWFGRRGEDVVTEDAEQIGKRVVRCVHAEPWVCVGLPERGQG